MELPEKSHYSVAEVAQRWNCSELDVIHFAADKKLLLAIYSRGLELAKCTENHEIDQESKSIFIYQQPIYISSSVAGKLLQGGQDISTNYFYTWDEEDDVHHYFSVTRINKNRGKTSYNRNKEVLKDGSTKTTTTTIKKKPDILFEKRPVSISLGDIIITLESIQYFETHIDQENENSNKPADNKNINPKEKATLLKIIAALTQLQYDMNKTKPTPLAKYIIENAAGKGIELDITERVLADKLREAKDFL